MKNKDSDRFVSLATAISTNDQAFLGAMRARNPVPKTVDEIRDVVDAGMRAASGKNEKVFVFVNGRSQMRQVSGYTLDSAGRRVPTPLLQAGESFSIGPHGRPTIQRG